MKKTRINYLILTLAIFTGSLFTTSCNKRNHAIQSIVVDVNIDKSDLVIENAKIAEIIELRDSLPIGEIRKLEYYGEKYFLLDKSSNKMLCFDKSGRSLYTINSLSSNSEEPFTIHNFFIDFNNNTLNIITQENSIFEYTIENGEFITKKDIDVNTYLISDGIMLNESSNQNIIALATLGPSHNLIITNDSHINRLLPFDQVRDFAFSEKAFASSGKGTLFTYGTDNNIYSITQDSAVPTYIIDFGNATLPPGKYENTSQLQEVFKNLEIATKIDNIFETEGFVSFSYFYFPKNSLDLSRRFVLYSKPNNISLNIKDNNYLFPIRTHSGRDTLVSITTPSSIINFSNSSAITKQIKEYINTNEITQTNHPLIIKWTISIEQPVK